MSGIDKSEQMRVAALQAEFLARGGEIKKCPAHASATGNMRFSYARKAQREAEETRKAQEMERTREEWNREMGFVQEAKNDATGYEGER